MPSPNDIFKMHARESQPYTVPNEAYRAAIDSGTITPADLREWGMGENRIEAIQSGPIRGCTDPAATNYNPNATQDDRSCVYKPKLGCTDPKAENYDPEATEDDGTCRYEPLPGCTDPAAENYNPEATEDDGSCEYIEGCTNPEAENYDPEATKDDGSCIMPTRQNLKSIVEDVQEGRSSLAGTLQGLDISQDDWRNIVAHYDENPMPDWEGIPVLPAKKTDLWVLGIPASGKSAMLSAVLGRLAAHGVLLGPNYAVHPAGFKYRNYLENAYKLGMFPDSTHTKGFNFIPLDMLVSPGGGWLSKASYQPCNLIEMSGEKIKDLLTKKDEEREQDESLKSLEWLDSRNHKVITIVLDIMNRDLEQLSNLNQAFQLFRQKGVFDLTKKIIILPSKVDKLDSFTPEGGLELNTEVKNKMDQDFSSLLTTINVYFKGPVKTCPFTVGSDIVKDAYLKGDRHVKFIDHYISELRKSIPAKKIKL